MNTATSLFLAGVIGVFLLIDALLFGWQLSTFLVLRFMRLIEWAAFWR